MASGNDASNIIDRIRKAGNDTVARLAALRPGTKAPAPTNNLYVETPDPTVGVYGDMDSGEMAGALPLSAQLEESAQAIRLRADGLRTDADRLVARIGERAEAEITLATQALRVLIGLTWLGVAAWLYNGALTAKANDLAILANGMPADDAFVLSRTFLIVAAIGLGVAFTVSTLVTAFGNGSNDRIRREAEELGLKIAETSRDFDHALTQYREGMDRRGNPADAVDDLSRAYLTALEAQAYFREIQFITGAEGAEAALKFKGFLRRPSAPPPALPTLIAGILMGVFLGAGYVYMTYVPKPEVVEPASPLAIAQYPWAFNLLFFGGVAYATAGVAVTILGGLFVSGATAKARAEALDALRGAFTAREAPRPADVVRRIEDAVQVFRARVGGRGAGGMGKTNQAGAQSQGFASEDDDIPHWRRRDSSAKFVDAGFQAAPTSWRTDAYEKKLSEKPEAKRGLLSFKNQRSD